MLTVEMQNTIDLVNEETKRRLRLCSKNREEARSLGPVATQTLRRCNNDRNHPDYVAVLERWHALNREHEQLSREFREALFVREEVLEYYESIKEIPHG